MPGHGTDKCWQLDAKPFYPSHRHPDAECHCWHSSQSTTSRRKGTRINPRIDSKACHSFEFIIAGVQMREVPPPAYISEYDTEEGELIKTESNSRARHRGEGTHKIILAYDLHNLTITSVSLNRRADAGGAAAGLCTRVRHRGDPHSMKLASILKSSSLAFLFFSQACRCGRCRRRRTYQSTT